MYEPPKYLQEYRAMRPIEYDNSESPTFYPSNTWDNYKSQEYASRQPNRERPRKSSGFIAAVCILLAIASVAIYFAVIPNFNQSAPSIKAASVIMVDPASENILYRSNETTQRAMASLTKIMTAMVTIESTADLNQQVKIRYDVTNIDNDASKMGCRPGERYSMKDLLYGLLLPSGDDAAIAIADGVSGSESAFVDRMNQKASDLHLENTHFANSHGLDVDSSLNDGNYSNAMDLIQLTKSAMQLSLFRQIVGTDNYDIPETATHREVVLNNTNEFLNDYSSLQGIDFTRDGSDLGIVGVKTGSTANAGYCLILDARKNGHEVILVLLGEPYINSLKEQRFIDAKALLQWTFKKMGQ
jgi:serine-type D-Ala-D-Ala carboxypeptidase (penicillin-binding protein 5/6)